jgi:multidrug efflux pump subunit AcrA (membrane-fusion protein)
VAAGRSSLIDRPAAAQLPTYDRAVHRRSCLAVVCAALATAACSGGAPSKVGVASVGRSTVTEVVEAAGTVAARASVSLNAPADGTVASLGVRDGQRVGAGTVLLRIDSPSAQQRLAQATQAAAATSSTPSLSAPDFGGLQAQVTAAATAAFTAARAAAASIPDAAARNQALAQIDAAQRRYDAAAAQAAAATARLSAGIGSIGDALASLGAAQRVQAQAAVDLAQQTVDSLTVRAPITGIVSFGSGGASGQNASSAVSGLIGSLPSQVQDQAAQALGGSGTGAVSDTVAVGVPVRAGTTVVTITDVSTLSLVADVDETDVLQVRPGVVATAQLDAVPDATYRATVTGVDVTPGQSSRGGVSYQVKLALGGGTLSDGSPAPRPRPGMSAVVDLQVRRAVDVVSVPASAVVRDAAQTTVWADEAGVARRRVVTLGAQGDAVVQVLSGVREGERVVVHGADTVREGQRLPR